MTKSGKELFQIEEEEEEKTENIEQEEKKREKNIVCIMHVREREKKTRR